MKKKRATKRKRRSAILAGLLILFAPISLFLPGGHVDAQKIASPQKNADGGTTNIENLPGGGARATTKDANGNVQDTVTTVANSKYGSGGTKVIVQTNAGGHDIDIELYKDATGQVRELGYTDYGPKDKIEKYELKAKYNDKGYLESSDEKLNNKDVVRKDPYPEEGGDPQERIRTQIWNRAADFIRKGNEITQTRFGTTTPGRKIQTDVEQPNSSKPTLTPSTKPNRSEESKTSDQPKTETPSTPEPKKTNGDSSAPE